MLRKCWVGLKSHLEMPAIFTIHLFDLKTAWRDTQMNDVTPLLTEATESPDSEHVASGQHFT